MEDDFRARDRDVGAEVIGPGHVLNVLPVRSSREDDGVITARELTYGESLYPVADGGLNGVNDNLV